MTLLFPPPEIMAQPKMLQAITRLLPRHPIIRIVLVGIVAMFCALLILWLTAGMWLRAIGHWFDLPATPKTTPVDAIVVLAGGGPERMAMGITYYREGIAPELWYTGDAPSPELPSFNDGHMARRYAIEQGVPEQAIVLLESTSTWEDGQSIAALAKERHVKRLLLVTSWYHGRRGWCVVHHHLKQHGLDTELLFSPAPTTVYDADSWWKHEHGLVHITNEIIKWLFYWRNYGLAPWACD